MHQLTRFDVVAFCGQVAVIWSTSPSTVKALAVSQARGPHYRADVAIGSYALSPLSGPLLVHTTALADLPHDVDVVVIGALTDRLKADINNAMKREIEARRVEASAYSSALFSACRPSFRSGGRRVGARVMA